LSGPLHGPSSLPERLETSVVYLNAPHQLEIRHEILPTRRLEPGRILCETLVTVISPGTELGAYLGLPPLRPGVTYPRLQGYCNVARVLATSAGVDHVSPGDRVLTFSSHRSHFIAGCDDVLLVLEPQDRAEEIVCTYLYHLAYSAVLRSRVNPGSRVLVIGIGALGLTSVAVAGLAGARVFGVSDHIAPRQLALESGAIAVFPRNKVDALRGALSAGLADVVIVTTNSWEDWALALEMAAMRGTIACLGFPGRNKPPGSFNPLDSKFFYVKQLRIEAAGISAERPDARGFLRFNERENLSYLAQLIRSGRLKPGLLVSAHYAASDIEAAYRDLLAHKNSAITYLLQWQ
jgi:NADPH:quinone reductase-like Zn-dependent oxidoreductase